MMAGACVSLALRIGGARSVLDLVPHLARHARHQLLERRLLVAETAAALSGQQAVAAAMAGPVLSLVATLLRDPAASVRCRALDALTQLLGALEPSQAAAALPDATSLLLAAAANDSCDVAHQLLHCALPAALAVAGHSSLLTAQLLPRLLDAVLSLLSSEAGAGNGVSSSAEQHVGCKAGALRVLV